jgi:hypothetical protein
MGSLGLAAICSSFVGVIGGMLYIYSPLPMAGISAVCFCLVLLVVVGVFFNFRRTAYAKGKIDGKEMATKYEEIK